MDLQAMRRSYERGSLDDGAAPADPLDLARAWLDEARQSGEVEPNAMTLATVGPDCRPSSRIVLAKNLDERGITWFTGYRSRKGRELAQNPYAAVHFYWPLLERVARAEGRVERVPAEESDAYWLRRPPGSRIGAAASPQSQVVASRAVLEENVRRLQEEHGDDPPRPPDWGGFRLVPDTWEFWQGRPSRVHDRLRYRQDGSTWVVERLAP